MNISAYESRLAVETVFNERAVSRVKEIESSKVKAMLASVASIFTN